MTNELIDMGTYAVCPAGTGCSGEQSGRHNCNGVGIEHLVLDGGGQTPGIVNSFAEELSYVHDVSMINLGGTGLALSVYINGGKEQGDANNSGPYSNLYISTTGQNGQCVQFVGASSTYPLTDTRGVHGLTCLPGTPSTGAAISIDYSLNNTFEDVIIEDPNKSKQLDGIRLGPNGIASGNVLMNIAGSYLANVIHIEGNTSTPTTTSYTCPGNYNVCDLTIAGVSGTNTTATIEDDLVPPTTPVYKVADQTVGIYIVGEQIGAGFSRFTTSNSVATWLVGMQAPSQAACTDGDLFSNISATNGASALWACTNGTNHWSPVASQ